MSYGCYPISELAVYGCYPISELSVYGYYPISELAALPYSKMSSIPTTAAVAENETDINSLIHNLN